MFAALRRMRSIRRVLRANPQFERCYVCGIIFVSHEVYDLHLCEIRGRKKRSRCCGVSIYDSRFTTTVVDGVPVCCRRRER